MTTPSRVSGSARSQRAKDRANDQVRALAIKNEERVKALETQVAKLETRLKALETA